MSFSTTFSSSKKSTNKNLTVCASHHNTGEATTTQQGLHNRKQYAQKLNRCISLSPKSRSLIRDVAEFALANGLSLNLNTLRVLLSLRQHENPLLVTSQGLWSLMAVEVPSWAGSQKIEFPEDVEQTLGVLLSYLHSTQRFHPESDSISALRRELNDY